MAHNWPTRAEWQADAARYTRTRTSQYDRIPRKLSAYLTDEETTALGHLTEHVIRTTRAALTRARRGDQRPHLNAAGRAVRDELKSTDPVITTIIYDGRTITTMAREAGADSEPVERLAALLATLRTHYLAAAEQAEAAAIAAEEARRTTDEAWEAELQRRQRVEAGPQVKTITCNRDGSTTETGWRPLGWQPFGGSRPAPTSPDNAT